MPRGVSVAHPFEKREGWGLIPHGGSKGRGSYGKDTGFSPRVMKGSNPLRPT